ncbi:MAG: hypothetical protein GX826_10665 [Gammaproteobacteria bacterium]|nr:hypothetical protein [Gammaproteobacteria bacterium]
MNLEADSQAAGTVAAASHENWQQAEAACVSGFHALGRIAGLMQRHGVPEPMAHANVLAVATLSEPMELARAVAAMLEELDHPAMAARMESGPGWLRMGSPSRGYLLVLDTRAPWLWLSTGHGKAGALCFIGPCGSKARLCLTREHAGQRQGARLAVMGGPRFKAWCRSALRRQIDLEVMLKAVLDSPFYGDPAAAAGAPPPMPLLEQATALAQARGIACAAPSLALPQLGMPESETGFDPAPLRDHCLHVWHMAQQDEAALETSASIG